MIVAATTIALRPAQPADRDFLARVYASTRMDELAHVGWAPDQLAGFLEHQFSAQTKHYARHYPDATFDVVLVDGEPAGRLIVDRWEHELRIVDITLLPEFRGRGVGTRLLTDVLGEAEERGAKVSIHVEANNPAMTLYRRLGFSGVSSHGVYLLMERPA